MKNNEAKASAKDKIFIVDDSAVKREVTLRAIINSYDVMSASSGQEALSMLVDEIPDLILLDVEMPEMNGYEVIKHLKSSERLKGIPVIFLTARTDESSEIYGLSLGAIDYIKIPISAPLLLKRLELHLSLKKQRNELHNFNNNLMRLVADRTAEIEKSQGKLLLARDAAEAANRTKSAFLANMSHEIRTPLNSIIGFLELAQDGDIPQKTRNYIFKVLENAKWLLKIINDILDISKIESGKIELEHIPFDLCDIIENCQSSLFMKTAEKGVALYCNVEPSINVKLLGDSVRLRQALMNLLSNAAKFTNEGNVSLLASVKDINNEKATITFEVSDTGIGMNTDQIARIFLPFMQADDSITRQYGGTGLGLSITKGIIEMMGGELEVESEVGSGSKFSFTLSFDLVHADVDVPETILLSDLEKPNFSGEILICEDNNLNQQVICEHLARVGLRTVVANNGEEGVRAVTERLEGGGKPFDLIFMDIHMPVMDGLEAASIIAGLGVETPIVALTANIMSNDLKLYRENGMPVYLGKPFTSQELWSCLIKYLQVDGFTTVDRNQFSLDEDKALRQLQIYFARSNQTTLSRIKQAISDGEMRLAHRLTHTLKGNAGQIGEKGLQAAAAEAEDMLSHEKSKITETQLDLLEAELNTVLEKLAPMVDAEDNKAPETIDVEAVLKVFEELEPMLVKRKAECMNLLVPIRAIQGAEELARLVEDFEFALALGELNDLKGRLGLD